MIAVAAIAAMGFASLQLQVKQAWVARYDGPGNYHDHPNALTVDANGNIYIAGSSYPAGSQWDEDYTILKYGPRGNKIWEARYDLTDNDRIWAMGLDAQSNVYVTGTAGTRKYNSSGGLVWAQGAIGGNDLKVLPDGTLYLASSSAGDALTIKLDSGGNVLWQRTYNGQANQSDTATLVEVDPLGFVFVAGYQDSTHDGETTNFMLLMYNSAGGLQWGASYNGSASDNDLVLGLALDSQGNPVVAGWSNVPAFFGDGDISTVKFNRSGVKLWDRTFDGEDEIHDRPCGLAIDANDNVIVAGNSDSFAKSTDYVVLKYSSSGVPLWGEFFDGGASLFDQATAIAVDGQGFIYVTGGCYRTSGVPQDIATLKYSPMGALVWKKFYDSPFADGDAATHMAIDRWNGVALVGESWGAGSQIDMVAVKYVQVTKAPGK